MIYLGLYLMYIVGGGILLTNYPKLALAHYGAVLLQLAIYAIMYFYWKKNYDSAGIKEKVIAQSELPIHKRETLMKVGNWGFLVLVYFSQQVMVEPMVTPAYYVSTILDFALIFFAMYPLVVESNIGFKKAGIPKVVIIAVLTVVAALFFNGTYNYIMQVLGFLPEAGDVSLNQVTVVNMVLADPMRSFLMITFAAAIMEEWIFRGLAFRTLLNRNRFVAYLVTFVIFSLPHLIIGIATTGLSEFIFMPVYGMMGVFFAFSYEYTETIYTSMLAHLLNNALSFISILFLSNL